MMRLAILLFLSFATFGSDNVGKRDVWVLLSSEMIPQVATGDGWQTSTSLVNLDADTKTFKVVFRTADGKPWNVALVGRSAATEHTVTLAPLQSTSLVTVDTGTLQQGWARLDVPCCTYIGGLAVFRQRVAGRPDFEAVVPISTGDNRSFLFYDNTGGYSTGIAIANASTYSRATVTLAVRNEAGERVALEQLDVEPDGRVVFSLPVQVPSTVGQKGTIELTSAGYFSVLGLRFNPGGSFTSSHSLEP